MKQSKSSSRRDILKGSTALALGTVFATPARAEAPPAEAITPELIEAAKKEGKVVWYTSIDLPVAEKIARRLQGEIRRHRGAGRAHRRRAGVPAHRPGICQQRPRRRRREFVRRLASAGLEEAGHPAALRAGGRREILQARAPRSPTAPMPASAPRCSPIAYNTNLVKAEDAPKSFNDLLDPKWKGKIVKAHPGYSGTIMTATFEMVRDIGWDFLRATRQAERHAGAVGDRSAEEARARRARGDGRRQRIQYLPAEGSRPAGRSRSIRPRARRSSSAPTASSRRRRIRTRQSCSRTTASRRKRRSSSSRSAACARCIRRSRKSPAASR